MHAFTEAADVLELDLLRMKNCRHGDTDIFVAIMPEASQTQGQLRKTLEESNPMSQRQVPSDKDPAQTRAEKIDRLSENAIALAILADEMVVLLSTYDELNWAQTFANFAKDIRSAQTDKARRSAIAYINSIYGGMGSWNDFYLHGFGQPEERRSSLGYQIQADSNAMLTDIDTGVQEIPRGVWQRIKQVLLE